MGFWPYLRHAHTSDDEPSAGTWQTTFFTWFFLRSARKTASAASLQNTRAFNLPKKETSQ